MIANPSAIQDVAIVRDVNLADTHFVMHVGLMQRKIILEDTTLNIKKIYAIGIGSFDEGIYHVGQTSVLTSIVKDALLEESFAESSRRHPSYFAGRPFLRISSGAGGYTVFGFHYSITPNLIRGFVSHGCMRMRDKDLYELFYILKNQASGQIPIDMKYWQADQSDTPYPLTNSSYFRIKNFGTVEVPQVDRGKNDDLVILEERRGQPPMDKIKDY